MYCYHYCTLTTRAERRIVPAAKQILQIELALAMAHQYKLIRSAHQVVAEAIKQVSFG